MTTSDFEGRLAALEARDRERQGQVPGSQGPDFGAQGMTPLGGTDQNIASALLGLDEERERARVEKDHAQAKVVEDESK